MLSRKLSLLSFIIAFSISASEKPQDKKPEAPKPLSSNKVCAAVAAPFFAFGAYPASATVFGVCKWVKGDTAYHKAQALLAEKQASDLNK